MISITLTLEIPWESVRSFDKQYIRTSEGPRISVLSLAKALLNARNKISIEKNVLTFDEDLLNSGLTINSPILYFFRVNNGGADGYVKNIKYQEEEIEIIFYDSNPIIGFKQRVDSNQIIIPTFGMEYEELFNILEESGVISRVSVYAFLVLNKEAFYELSGGKRPSWEDALIILGKINNSSK